MIERLLRVAHQRRGLVLLAGVAAFVASLALVLRISFDANILNLLPRRGPAVRSFNAYLEHFGTLDSVYVLFEVPPGGQISDHEEFVDRYVDLLRKAPEIASVDAELFDSVKDWSYLFDRELLLLGRDRASAALERFTPESMAGELTRSRGLLAMSGPDVKAYVQQDPLGLLRLLRERLARGEALMSFDPTQKGYVSKDGRSRLVVAKPVQPPFDTDFCKRLFDRLGRVEADARKETTDVSADPLAGGSTRDVGVRIAGGYRIALEAEHAIRTESIANSVISLIGLLLLVFVVFRAPWILLYGTIPLVIAALFTLGVNGLTGPLSPATSGSSAMLFGLGIDGIVLVYLRYMEERGRDLAPEDAIARSAGTATSVMLAYGTTAATFLALMLVDFPSLEELGRLVGLGILVCLALLLTLLPALIGFTRPEVRRHPVTSAWLGRFVERFGRPILGAAAVLTLVLGAAALRLRLDTSLEKLQARTAGTALEQELADRFSLPKDVVLALGEGPALEPLLESAQALSRAVERDTPSMAQSSPDTLLPPASQQDQVAALLARERLDPARVGADLERVARDVGFVPGAFAAFNGRLPRMLDPKARLTYDGLVRHGFTPLISRYVSRTSGGFLAVVYLYPRSAAELDRVERLVATSAPSFHLTGVPPVNRELAARFLPQFLKGVIAGTLVIIALVYVTFRTVRDTLLAFLPTVLGLVWSAGLLAVAGVRLDLFSLFAAMTFIGIATDYGIYVIYRHRIEHTGQVREVLTRTGAGILIAAGATLIGFGSLVNSSYGPLHSFGLTSVTTIASCLVASLLVLPALLQEAQRP
jgi:predicted RND superfamily exporter protein